MQQIEEITNGRVKVTMYPGGAIAKVNEVWEAIETGLADIGYVPVIQYYSSRAPLTTLVSLPFAGAPTTVALGRAWADLYHKFPEMQNEYRGVKWLTTYGIPTNQVHMVKKPVHTLEDLKGMKIRPSAAGPAFDFYRAAGAVPVSIARPDLYISLERGIVDGCEHNMVGVQSEGIYKIVKYSTIVNASSTFLTFLMNEDTWNSFPPDIQEAIWNEMGGKAGADYIDTRLDKLVVELTEWFQSPEVGIEVIHLSPEEQARWQDLAKPIWAAEIAELEAKGLPAQAFFDEYLRLVKM